MAGRLLLPANTSWSQTGSAGDFGVQFEPLKGLAVFIARAVRVCAPLNTLQLCALITSLDALIITKKQGEGRNGLTPALQDCDFCHQGQKILDKSSHTSHLPTLWIGITTLSLLPRLFEVPRLSVFVKRVWPSGAGSYLC